MNHDELAALGSQNQLLLARNAQLKAEYDSLQEELRSLLTTHEREGDWMTQRYRKVVHSIGKELRQFQCPYKRKYDNLLKEVTRNRNSNLN